MNATALIAEDEPLLAEGLKAELARAWPELAIAAMVGDGQSAVDQALALQPSVCFFDIRMPGLSGLEAAQVLAEDWPAGTPFPLLVFVTAYDQYALQAFEAQAVDYLVKPVTPARLAECVARLRGRLQAQRPATAPGAATPAGAALAASRHAETLEQTLDGSGRYYESIDLVDAMHPQTILAYEMNDATLPVRHGYPLRLRVERQLGYKHAKYVMRIEAVSDFSQIGRGQGGFWPDRGYEWYAGI